jgi:glycerol-3-phosphate dehydrogenase (NAD(P)+)
MTEIAKPRVAVLGGGSFGTVIANLAAGNGCPTTQWLRDADLVEEMQTTHENTRYLKGFTLHESLQFSSDLAQTVSQADLVFVAIPSKAFAKLFKRLNPIFMPNKCSLV